MAESEGKSMHDLPLSQGSMQSLHPGRLDEESGDRSSLAAVERPDHIGVGEGRERIAHSL